MKNLLPLICLFLSPSLWAQQKAVSENKHEDYTAVIQVVQQLFDGMRAGDSAVVRSVFSPEARLNTTFTDRSGKPRMVVDPIDGFVTSVGTPHEQVYDEKIWSYEVQLEDRLATVWTDYTFYLGDKMSHCGVNAFQLFKGESGWKIFQISDTRRRQGCQTSPIVPKDSIAQLLDNWHLAAAEADEEVFFGSMTAEAVYIGTDATEHWTKSEFEKWSKPFFDRESAWNFKATSRNIFIDRDGQMAWFDELLDTWMGPCRASGLLQKEGKEWKIAHYHLSVTVPNEKIKGFLKAMEE
ncbi:MAG: nuclear transport factor 2 family protein [Bacteroidota bacterium]